MVYNKTKRNLEGIAGLLGIFYIPILICVCVHICRLLANVDYSMTLSLFSINLDYGTILILLIYLLTSTLNLTLYSIAILINPVNENNEVSNHDKRRVSFVISAVIAGAIIPAGIEIAALCLKDLVPNSIKKE